MNLLDLSSMHLADVIDFADLSNTVYISISLCFIQSMFYIVILVQIQNVFVSFELMQAQERHHMREA